MAALRGGMSLPVTAFLNEISSIQEEGRNVLRLSSGFLC